MIISSIWTEVEKRARAPFKNITREKTDQIKREHIMSYMKKYTNKLTQIKIELQFESSRSYSDSDR